MKAKVKKTRSSKLQLDKRLAVLIVIGCFGLSALFGWLWQRQQARQIEIDDANQALAITNLPYCNGEKLDLFVPQTTKNVPIIVYIHGGGWKYGSKVGGSLPNFKSMVDGGFAVASINYRLSGVKKFPAQIQDVYCAIRFLKTHSQLYNLDKSKVGVAGVSAGGHLAALAAAARDQASFTLGDNQQESNEVQAAVSIAGLLDLNAENFTKVSNQNIYELLGANGDKLAASPQRYLTPDDPPLLIIHGDKDKHVPLSQATNFVKAGQSVGIKVTFLPVKSANHNLQTFFGNTVPAKQDILNTITEFFKTNFNH